MAPAEHRERGTVGLLLLRLKQGSMLVQVSSFSRQLRAYARERRHSAIGQALRRQAARLRFRLRTHPPDSAPAARTACRHFYVPACAGAAPPFAQHHRSDGRAGTATVRKPRRMPSPNALSVCDVPLARGTAGGYVSGVRVLPRTPQPTGEDPAVLPARRLRAAGPFLLPSMLLLPLRSVRCPMPAISGQETDPRGRKRDYRTVR